MTHRMHRSASRRGMTASDRMGDKLLLPLKGRLAEHNPTSGEHQQQMHRD